jgi:hypothetical protein
MTWINLNHHWGLPAVYLSLAREYLARWDEAQRLLPALDDTEAARCRVQAFVTPFLAGRYPGAEVVGLHYDMARDALLILVLHPLFPRTKPYERIPSWPLIVTDEGDGTRRLRVDDTTSG